MTTKSQRDEDWNDDQIELANQMASEQEAMDSTAYGFCLTCGVLLMTKEDADQHRKETLEESGSRSHATRIINPTLEEVFARRIRSIVEEAITNAMEDIDTVLRHEEGSDPRWVRPALTGFPDFRDAWDDWVAETE